MYSNFACIISTFALKSQMKHRARYILFFFHLNKLSLPFKELLGPIKIKLGSIT